MTSETSENTIFLGFYFNLCYLMLTVLRNSERPNCSSLKSRVGFTRNSFQFGSTDVLHLHLLGPIPSISSDNC